MEANEKRAAIAGVAGLTFGSVSVWITSGSLYAAILTLVIGSILGGIGIFTTRSIMSRKD